MGPAAAPTMEHRGNLTKVHTGEGEERLGEGANDIQSRSEGQTEKVSIAM
jgi:hypothetical protein